MTAENVNNLLDELRQKLISYRAQLTLMRETAPFDDSERFREDWVEPLERLITRLEKNEAADLSDSTAADS